MDNVRLFLIMALGFLSLLLWEAWQEDYVIPQKQSEQASYQQDSESINLPNDGPEVPLIVNIDEASADQPLVIAEKKAFSDDRLIKVYTDTLNIMIDPKGGSIVDAKLKKYPVSTKTPDIKYHLMSQRPNDFFIGQSGLLGNEKSQAPSHQSTTPPSHRRRTRCASPRTGS